MYVYIYIHTNAHTYTYIYLYIYNRDETMVEQQQNNLQTFKIITIIVD